MKQGVLLELADKLEAATGEDAYLDLDIHRAVGDDPGAELGDALDYTLSLDDALKLVPEGCITTIGGGLNIGTAAIESGGEIYGSKAATPALALCAASLRALAASPESKEGK